MAIYFVEINKIMNMEKMGTDVPQKEISTEEEQEDNNLRKEISKRSMRDLRAAIETLNEKLGDELYEDDHENLNKRKVLIEQRIAELEKTEK